MNHVLFLLLLFSFLLLFPILWGMLWYFRGKSSVLPVRQDRRRDPRYFAKSFESMILNAWSEKEDGIISLSRSEPYILADKLSAQDYPPVVNALIIAGKTEFMPPKDVSFQKEIFSLKNARFPTGCKLRAVCGKDKLLFEPGVSILRWADADGTIAVYDDCDLGISLSSATAITLGKNCHFRRLYAPVILFGAYPGSPLSPSWVRDERIYHMSPPDIGWKRRRRVSRSDVREDDGVAPFSYVSEGSLVVEEGLLIQGSLRAKGSIHISERAVICGNIFSDGDISLDKDSTVLGTVFSQGNINFETGVVVGRANHISSVVARGQIRMGEGCFVYGYVSNEKGGLSCPTHQEDSPSAPRWDSIRFLDWPEPVRHLRFSSVDEFLQLDHQGFRHNQHLQSVHIPEGVKRIPDSMFFDCRNLMQVSLPSTLEEIGSYAFADCIRLQYPQLHRLPRLHTIERSAFDGCLSLTMLQFPPSLDTLGSAAFCGCKNLKHVDLGGAALQHLGNHCFHNCPVEPLDDLALPDEANKEKGEVSLGV